MKALPTILRLPVVVIALCGMVCMSCEKNEEPIVLPQVDGTPKLITVSLGPAYDKQVYVNVEDQRTTVIDNNSWDLSFDAGVGYNVYMNGGKGVLITQSS